MNTRTFHIYYDPSTKVATFLEQKSTEHGEHIGGLTTVLDPNTPPNTAFVVDALLRRRGIKTTGVTIDDLALRSN